MIRMGDVTSTMDIVRRLEIMGVPEGVAVLAASQSRGRGRADRTWQSPANGGLYCSVLLRPDIPVDRFQAFSIATGLAVCDALDPDASLGLQLKWPNDIVARDLKLGGVLITTNVQHARVASAVVGIGVNLRPTPAMLETAISLQQLSPDARSTPVATAHCIFDSLSRRYAMVLAGRSEDAIADWPDRLAYRGQQVSLQDGQILRTGTLRAIDATGSLIIDGPHGPVTVTSGELTRGPRLLDA